MAATRIYRVADGDHVRLINATSAAQAIRFCAMARYHIAPAKAADVAYLMGKGIKVENASDEE